MPKGPANAPVLPASAAGVLETGAFADLSAFVVGDQGVQAWLSTVPRRSRAKRASSWLPRRDPLYLFACYLEWQNEANLRAFQELLAGFSRSHEDTRIIAESFLGRPSPRRRQADGNRDRTPAPVMKPQPRISASPAINTKNKPHS